MTGIEESGEFAAAEAPATAVAVPRHMGAGTDLVHSLDYVVLLQVMFNVASGAKSTPPMVWQQLKTRGIRSAKNAAELVGRNAVYESFARLIEAGYLRRTELPNEKHPGRKGPVVYRVYDNPAWNPDWQVRQVGTEPLAHHGEEKPQVGTVPGTPEAAYGEVEETAGQNASRNAGSGNAGSGVSGSAERRVPAGQKASLVPGSGKGSPPHPPEGGGGTSPQPPKTGKATRADRYAESAALEPGDYTPSREQIQQADDFLQDLPGKWQMGPSQARACAPLAASRAHTQGYDLTDEQDRLLLEMVLTQDNPNDQVRRPSSVMPARLRDLKRKRAAGSESAHAGASAGGLAPWCGNCNRGEKPMAAFQRLVELDDGSDAPCPDCHPKNVRV